MIDCEIKISNWEQIRGDLPDFTKPGFTAETAVKYYKELAEKAIDEGVVSGKLKKKIAYDVIWSAYGLFDLREYPWGKYPELIAAMGDFLVNIGVDKYDIQMMMEWEVATRILDKIPFHFIKEEILHYLDSTAKIPEPWEPKQKTIKNDEEPSLPVSPVSNDFEQIDSPHLTGKLEQILVELKQVNLNLERVIIKLSKQ